MKKIQLILKPTSIFLCISILATETLFSQTVTISGSSAVSTGAQYYYQANFDYQLAPYTTISWSIGGGTIISQSINPTSTVYCVIEWTDDHSTGTITLDEEFDGGYAARTVDIGLPLIGGGTMNFYNQYETQQYWNIIASQATSYQWYKNGSPITGATDYDYLVSLIGLPSYTDYYYVVTPGGTSNTFTLSYHGCDDPSDYPVSVPSFECATHFPLTLTLPNLGTGTTYGWFVTYNPDPAYTFSNFSGNTCQANYGSCGTSCADGIFSWANNPSTGQDVIMYYVLVVNPGCRTKSVVTPETIIQERGKLFPNPANSQITITNPNRIEKIEIYNLLGSIAKRINANGSNIITIQLHDLKPGFYSCRIITNRGIETQKLIIQK